MNDTTNRSSSDNKDQSKFCASDIATESSNSKLDFKFSASPTFEEIHQLTNEFVNERNWNKYHTPRNLLLALVGEVGELSEVFQWKGEVAEGLPGWTAEEREHLGEELSDVLIYLLRLSAKCHVDLPAAVINKMEKNKQKYPSSKVYGSSKKYTEYKE